MALYFFNSLNCTLVVLFSALEIDSSLLPSLVPSLKLLHFAVGVWSLELQLGTRRVKGIPDSYFEVKSLETWNSEGSSKESISRSLRSNAKVQILTVLAC